MATPGLRKQVTNEPTPLNASDAGDNVPGKRLLLHNRSTSSIDLGDDTVTSGNGFELDADDSVAVELEHGETLYAVGPGPGPFRVDVLMSGAS
jgi:hypothetical protein